MADGPTTAAESPTSASPARHRSWWSRLWADMGRRIEHRGLVLWYLMFERGLKGLALIAAAAYLITHTDSGLHPVISRVITLFNLAAGSGFFHTVILNNLVKLAGLSENTIWVLAVASLIYGAIESTEAVGLALRRRWAEYLVVLATAFFIPFEIREVIDRPSLLRVGTFVVNVVVVVYLVRKKQLFQLGHPTEA